MLGSTLVAAGFLDKITGALSFSSLFSSKNPCGDGVCDKKSGETALNCPKDCGKPLTPGANPCGDGVCDTKSGESVSNCGEDCLPIKPLTPTPGASSKLSLENCKVYSGGANGNTICALKNSKESSDSKCIFAIHSDGGMYPCNSPLVGGNNLYHTALCC